MGEQILRLHQNGGLRYEAHLNGDESVEQFIDDDGNIDIYIRGMHDAGVVHTGPLAADLNAVPEETVEVEVPDEDNPENWTKAEIQDELRDRGLPTSGNKDELIARLEEDTL